MSIVSEDMRGLFFIVQGQYRRNLEPVFQNPVSESVNWCGGYDPTSPSTEKWYMLFDWPTLTCHCASSDLDYVLGGVGRIITKYKTKERLITALKNLSFGVSSKSTKVLDEHLGHLYGHHFAALIREQEDLAYEQVREQDPIVKARKKLKRRVNTVVETTPPPAQTQVLDTSGTHKKRKGLKPVKRQVNVSFE